MVIDKLSNAHLYYGLGKNFRTALEWLTHVDPDTLTPWERVDIDGDQVYATRFDVDTLPVEECKLEAHRDYADIQFVLEGEEALGYILEGPAEELAPYEPDIQFFKGPWDTITVKAGTFYIVWPEDLHAPRVALDQPIPVKRIVVKVRL